MIKAIVLDIDGVIIGNQKGINFPHPSKKVREILQKIHSNGIPVSFLTAKPTFAAIENIKFIGIDNPHIADGGATIFNPLHNHIIHSTTLPAKEIVPLLRALPPQTYLNLFSLTDYYLLKQCKNDFTARYEKFLERSPLLVTAMEEVAKKEPITKINIYAFNKKETEEIARVVSALPGEFSTSWSQNPSLPLTDIMVVTAKDVSKRSGVAYLADYLHVPLDAVLGVGDTMHDWDFLEICGYKGAMGNATQELMGKIDVNDPKQAIGGHVNEDGLLEIFNHFGL